MNPLDPFGGDDAAPDEPEEFDPNSLGPDPPDPTGNVESDLEGSLGDGEDVDEELFRSFWAAVFFLNVALAGLAMGAMLVGFRGDWSTGGPALLVGGVAALFTGKYYWKGSRHAGGTAGGHGTNGSVGADDGGAGRDAGQSGDADAGSVPDPDDSADAADIDAAIHDIDAAAVDDEDIDDDTGGEASGR